VVLECIGSHFDFKFITLASQIHELASAIVLRDDAAASGIMTSQTPLASILGTVSPILAQWGQLWPALVDVEAFLQLRLARNLFCCIQGRFLEQKSMVHVNSHDNKVGTQIRVGNQVEANYNAKWVRKLIRTAACRSWEIPA
jgi:hypothetical protein